jgi:hypothetical protein
MKLYFNLISTIFIFISVLLFYCAFTKTSYKKNTFTKSPTEKVLYNNIVIRDTIIKTKTIIVDKHKKELLSFSNKLKVLKHKLDSIRFLKDNQQIINIQDTIINITELEKLSNNIIISNQDTIIKSLKENNLFRDTIINIQKINTLKLKTDIKQLKRQRNISFILTVLFSTFLIIK